MLTRSLVKQRSLLYRTIDFVGTTNIFISLCATSLTALSLKRNMGYVPREMLLLTFCATFILYNGQQLFLSLFYYGRQNRNWFGSRQKTLLMMMIFALAGLYPLFHFTPNQWLVYFIALLLGLSYFLPFTNLRGVPLLKSFLVGFVWVLVCVVIPTRTVDLFFCMAQLFLITALCLLFNIRDLKHDASVGTATLPVLYGEEVARWVTAALLIMYLLATGFTLYGILTFLAAIWLTFAATSKNHSFFYLFGVDGIILLQTCLAWLFLLA